MEWSVKHRPSKWSDIVGQTHITRVLADGLRTGNFPVRILMSGPPGTGKSSIAELSAKALMCDNLNDINPCGECASCLNKRLIKKFNMGEYKPLPTNFNLSTSFANRYCNHALTFSPETSVTTM